MIGLDGMLVLFMMTEIPFADVTSNFDNLQSAIWSKRILELGVGSCRCWLVPFVLSECLFDVFSEHTLCVQL